MTNYSPFAPRRSSPWPLVMAGAALVLATWLTIDRSGVLRSAPSAEPRPLTARGDLAALEQTFVEVFERCSPSVAHITTQTRVRTGLGARTQEGTGSGFVWDDQGTVVTNWHVVQGARNVSVAIGERTFAADVINGSPENDLAVLRLRGDVSGLVPIRIGSSKALRVGQLAIAIGNPFGFDQTLTTGVISALGRSIQTKEGGSLNGLIQIDAAINPGNSGGPVLDSAGLLIGVATAIYSPSGASAGLGFAVPSDTVNDVVPRLLGQVAAAAAAAAAMPRLGIVNQSAFRHCNVDVTGFQSGALFTEVVPGLGAAKAGLRPFIIADDGTPTQWGDVIVAVDARRIRRFEDIELSLRGKKVGDEIKLRVVRGLPDEQRLETIPIKLMSTNGRSM